MARAKAREVTRALESQAKKPEPGVPGTSEASFGEKETPGVKLSKANIVCFAKLIA